MLFRTKATIAGLMLGLASFGADALAQQPQTNNPASTVQQQRRGGLRRRAMRRRARMGMFRGFRELNLTDQQRQQARTIVQANRESTKAQREELRQIMQQRRQGTTLSPEAQNRAKELRAQLIEKRTGVRNQLNALLTAEQKTKLEEMIKARQENRGRFGRRNPVLE